MSPILRGAALAQTIDISCVQAFHGAPDVIKLARTANLHGFVAAHVLPNFVPLLKEALGTNSSCFVGAPVGFPAGGATINTKVAEAQELAALGAQEIDMMVNVGRLISGDLEYVLNEISAVVQSVTPIPVKILLEVHYLSTEQIQRGCELAIAGGGAFVKTSTGWAPGGATIANIQTIAEVTRGAIGIKASGGIRDLATVDKLLKLGVTRFGINTNAAVALIAKTEDELE